MCRGAGRDEGGARSGHLSGRRQGAGALPGLSAPGSGSPWLLPGSDRRPAASSPRIRGQGSGVPGWKDTGEGMASYESTLDALPGATATAPPPPPPPSRSPSPCRTRREPELISGALVARLGKPHAGRMRRVG